MILKIMKRTKFRGEPIQVGKRSFSKLKHCPTRSAPTNGAKRKLVRIRNFVDYLELLQDAANHGWSQRKGYNYRGRLFCKFGQSRLF